MAGTPIVGGRALAGSPVSMDDGTTAYAVQMSGGGGGAATVADGADVAEGATTATSYTDVTGAASGTTIALLKGNYVLTAAMSAKLPASLGAKTGATSLSVAPASDGFAVVAGGSVASAATDSGNPVKTGAVFNTTAPTVTTGQRVDAQATTRGELLVSISNGAAQAAVTQPASDGASIAQNALVAYSLGRIYNGSTVDRLRKANAYKRVASSAASGNPDFAKNSAGDVMSFWGVNTQAALRYLHIYNKASAPTLGTDTPILSFPIPASSAFNVSIPNGGAYCSTGIAFAFTTDIIAIPATGAAAGDITAFAMLVA